MERTSERLVHMRTFAILRKCCQALEPEPLLSYELLNKHESKPYM